MKKGPRAPDSLDDGRADEKAPTTTPFVTTTVTSPPTSSAVLPMPLFGYLGAIRGRHSAVPHKNRALRLGMAGRRSGDTINFLGQLDA